MRKRRLYLYLLAFCLAMLGAGTLTAATIVGLGSALSDRYWLSSLLVGGALFAIAFFIVPRKRNTQRSLQEPNQNIKATSYPALLENAELGFFLGQALVRALQSNVRSYQSGGTHEYFSTHQKRPH